MPRPPRSRRLVRPSRALPLAGKIAALPTRVGYAIPYYTRSGGDTEYLLSNPGATVVGGVLLVFGKRCEIARRVRVAIKPHCTQTIRLRAIVPEHAAFSILITDGALIVHLLYLGERYLVMGGELAGRDNLLQPLTHERGRTYGFGYRALPLAGRVLEGSLFVSNPSAAPLTGLLVFFDQRCQPARRHKVSVKAGCTAEFPFPPGRFGYGLIQVSHQPVLNVLHYLPGTREVAAAELVGEANRIAGPAEPPRPRKKVLFDATHGCRPFAPNDWTTYEAALTSAGCSVARHTATPLTLAALQNHDVFAIVTARSAYSAAEKTALTGFVNAGGGLMIVQDFGNAPWSPPTREILNLFGTNDDNNTLTDPTNNVGGGQISHVIFDSTRNFVAHPIVSGITSFRVDAAATLAGGAGWSVVAESDDDSAPARRPVLIARSFGAGRVLAFGDSNTWADHLIGALDNRALGVRCAEWLLFRI